MTPEFQPPWSFSSPEGPVLSTVGFGHTVPSAWTSLSFLLAWPTLLSYRVSLSGGRDARAHPTSAHRQAQCLVKVGTYRGLLAPVC